MTINDILAPRPAHNSADMPYAMIPRDRFLRIKEVVYLTGLSRTEIYRRVADGRFPKQHRISPMIAVWRLSEIENWMDANVH